MEKSGLLSELSRKRKNLSERFGVKADAVIVRLEGGCAVKGVDDNRPI